MNNPFLSQFYDLHAFVQTHVRMCARPHVHTLTHATISIFSRILKKTGKVGKNC